MNGACPASVTLFHCRFPWQGSALPCVGTVSSAGHPADCTLHTTLSSEPTCVGTVSSAGYNLVPCRLYHAQLCPCVGTMSSAGYNLAECTLHSSEPAWAQCPVQGTLQSVPCTQHSALNLRGHKPTMSSARYNPACAQTNTNCAQCPVQGTSLPPAHCTLHIEPCRLYPAHYTRCSLLLASTVRCTLNNV